MNSSSPFSQLSARLPGGCWPTFSQTLLLRAALLEPVTALSAWEEWNQRDNFEAVDSGSFRLLGLVYRNLSRAGVSHPLIPRLHGVYRRFWTANQLILGRNAKLLSTFADAGIPTMLSKGAGLVVSAYKDYGTRPMDDLDLMVPHTHAVKAMELLESHGWESEFLNAKDLPESLHACHFRHDGLGLIDLHWQLFHVATPDDLKALVWRDAMTCSLNGHETLAPNFSDQFLHACEHGVRYNIVPPFRWLADCFYLWQASGENLDWHRIAAGARLTESVLPVKETLYFLRDHLDVRLPDEAFTLLENTRVTLHERIESRLVRRPCRNLLDKLPIDCFWHIRCTRGQSLLQRLSSFPKYFRTANNLEYGQLNTHYRAAVRRWFRDWLPYHLRQIPLLLRRKTSAAAKSLSDASLKDFHEIEPYEDRLLRWSKPEASVALPFAKGNHYRIVLDLGRIRDWDSDLSRGLGFQVNGCPLAAEQVQHHEGIVTIRIDETDVSPNERQEVRLSWRCVPMPADADPRALGLPLFSIGVEALTSASPGTV